MNYTMTVGEIRTAEGQISRYGQNQKLKFVKLVSVQIKFLGARASTSTSEEVVVSI